MGIGSRSGGDCRALKRRFGREARPVLRGRWGIGLFIEEGAYTTVASACAMLMVLALLFSSALAVWSASRAGDVQVSADSAALAGENVVSSYHTAATVLDACVLSLGLAGFSMMGAGMVGLFVPGGQSVARDTLDAARRVLDMRNSFASSASRGLKGVEASLPYLIAANAARICDAQGSGDIGCRGSAFAVPRASASEFPAIEDGGIDVEGLGRSCEGLESAAAELERVSEEVAAAKERAWMADCGRDGMNMQERAASLSGISDAENPDFTSSITWDPEVAIERARAYYRWRRENDGSDGQGVEARADAAARRAFYAYAYERLAEARVVDDGEEAYTTLEFLPRNTEEVRRTTLYTDARWPTSVEDDGVTLHFDRSCPGSAGVVGPPAAVSSIEDGSVRECPICRFGVDDLGRAPSASTSIDNGFEYHLRAFTRELKGYLEARGRQNEAEAIARGEAEAASSDFEDAISELGGRRPRIAPPGRYGCVSLVVSDGASAPDELRTSFAEVADLSGQGAIAAAVLAPSALPGGDDVLSGFLSSLEERVGAEGAVGLMDGVMDLWGGLLVSYGDMGSGLEEAFDGLTEGLASGGMGPAGSWLRNRLSDIVCALDLQPVDLRPRKPVLVDSADVLARSDVEGLANMQDALRGMSGVDLDFEAMARAIGYDLGERLGSLEIVLAEIELPGGRVVPITLRLGDVMDMGRSGYGGP